MLLDILTNGPTDGRTVCRAIVCLLFNNVHIYTVIQFHQCLPIVNQVMLFKRFVYTKYALKTNTGVNE